MSLEPINILTAIHQNSILGKLSVDQQKSISQFGKLVEFKPNEFIAKEGDPAEFFYLICEGRLSIEVHTHNGNIILQTLGINEIVGWSWLFEPYKWTFDVKAVENSVLIAFEGRSLLNELQKDHRLGFDFIKLFSTVITSRLHQTRLRLLDIYGE